MKSYRYFPGKVRPNWNWHGLSKTDIDHLLQPLMSVHKWAYSDYSNLDKLSDEVFSGHDKSWMKPLPPDWEDHPEKITKEQYWALTGMNLDSLLLEGEQLDLLIDQRDYLHIKSTDLESIYREAGISIPKSLIQIGGFRFINLFICPKCLNLDFPEYSYLSYQEYLEKQLHACWNGFTRNLQMDCPICKKPSIRTLLISSEYSDLYIDPDVSNIQNENELASYIFCKKPEDIEKDINAGLLDRWIS